MRKCKYLTILCCLLECGIEPCLASTVPLHALDDYIMQVYEKQNFSDQQDFTSIQEALQEAYLRPLDLNKVTPEELETLAILSDEQIRNFFSHLVTNGPLYSKYELQAIPSFDLDTIALLLPFIYVVESYDVATYTLWEKIKKGAHCVRIRYEPSWSLPSTKTKLGYLPLGNLDKWVVQATGNYPKLLVSIASNKQAGEAFCWDPRTHRYGFNLWSISLLFTGNSYFKRIILGDYQVGYGQGLLLHAGYVMEKGADIISLVRSYNVGIRPYKGMRRKGLRGMAMTFPIGPVEVTALYANHNLDAHIQWDTSHRPYVSRIDATAIYDTPLNLKKKGTLNEQVIGCTLRLPYTDKQTEIGLNALYHYYDLPIIPPKKHLSNNAFQGQQAIATSLFYRWLWHNNLFFGEGGIGFPDPTVKGKRADIALITGIIRSISRYVDLSFALYYYGAELYIPYGKPFKHYATDHGREKGIYGGIKWTAYSHWQLTTNGHLFYNLQTQSTIPKYGYSIITRSTYTWRPTTIWICQHKFNQIPKYTKIENGLSKNDHAVDMVQRNYLKCKINHQFTFAWCGNLEAQYIHYTLRQSTHHGHILAASGKWRGKKLQISLKTIYFQTDNYATRLYMHHYEPLYSGTIFRPYHGQGSAMDCLFCWKPLSWIRLECKYSVAYVSSMVIRKKTKSPKNEHKGVFQFIINF